MELSVRNSELQIRSTIADMHNMCDECLELCIYSELWAMPRRIECIRFGLFHAVSTTMQLLHISDAHNHTCCHSQIASLEGDLEDMT